MAVLLITLFVLLAALIISFRNRLFQRIDQLEKEVHQLRQELKRPGAPTTIAASPSPAEPTTARQPLSSSPGQQAAALPPLPPAPPEPGFFERHPDWEKFIGENLVSKIGIAVLVLAIGFFVKYAIDNDWVGPVGRVGIGLLCGGILIGLAHRLRSSYTAFSSILVGGGLAVFYFTIALAYHQYHLFSQTVSFIIMLIITAFAVVLSLLYDRQELAIIALVGGFVTPLLVSNGSGNYQILFSYLLILNTGLLVIAYNKSWRLLNLLAFGFTVILFTSWLVTLPYDAPVATYRGGFLFATTFFVLFCIINIAHNIKENIKFIASDFGILLANTCLYFGAGLYLITAMEMSEYRGLFSATMGAANLAASYFLFRQKKVDNNILYLLIGITLSFISLTAPLQLHGHYITLFWASESVLLYWLYGKSKIRIIAVSASLIWLAMLISLLMDWWHFYGFEIVDAEFGREHQPILFNKGFITSLYCAIACGILFQLRKGTRWANGILAVCCLLLWLGGSLEILYQFDLYYPGKNLAGLYLVLYGFFLAYLLVTAGIRWKWFSSYIYPGMLFLACLTAYLMVIPYHFSLQSVLLESGHYGAHFTAHWVSDGFVVLILIALISWLRSKKLPAVAASPVVPWLFCAMLVIFLSAEIQLLLNALAFSKAYSLAEIQRVYFKTGLPILWGGCSFAFMWLGMRHQFKPLRIVSLVLFSITLLKLFLFDIRNIPVAGKIAAFFCLGVLLLVVSFMYQRLKKIIIEDEEKKTV